MRYNAFTLANEEMEITIEKLEDLGFSGKKVSGNEADSLLELAQNAIYFLEIFGVVIDDVESIMAGVETYIYKET